MKNTQTLSILLCFSVLILLTACGNSAPSPTDFHVGNFKYGDEARFGDFVIIRTENSQVDSGTKTQLVVKFDLEWETDEAYTLRFNSVVANPQNIQLPELNGMYRKCWITEITDSSYVEVSTTSLSPDTITTQILKK